MSGSSRVLIIDDSLTVRMDLAEAFTAAGFEPLACATAQEARQALASGGVDIIVLDVILPDGDGIDLLQELREGAATAAIPVLLLSTEAEVKHRIRGLQMGANEYVGKPYERSDVVARARALAPRDPAREPSRPRVLVVDDSPTFREALAAALQQAGHDVLQAVSGEEGLRLAVLHRPTAVIVDGVLPGIDGASVIRKLRLDAALRRTPCVLLTAGGGADAELRALEAGADAFVRKEEELGVVMARLASLLRASSSTTEKGAASVLAPKRILAVDDSPTYLSELAEVLRGEGYDLVLAHSGEEALELLSVQPVDCILLDVMMPGLSGQETCRRIKAAPVIRDIPLILLTALEDREAMVEGLATGADDYISKASDVEVLKARVSAQLRRRQFEDEARRMRHALFQRDLEAAEARAAREIAESRATLVAELERKNKELEAFSYSVSHDLRAPLRSIDGFARMLAEECAGQLDEKARDYLDRVCRSARRMGELIDDLLSLSRVGSAELVRVPVDLSTLARSVAEDLARKEPSRQVELSIADTPKVEADPRLMRVVFENLLGNAWKFTGKTPSARIEMRAEEEPGRTTYRISDNGSGFDMQYATRLFQPFQRLHNAAEFAGTGVGLATVYRVIDRHGGRVWAEGHAGKGATFFFSLPSSPARR